MRTMIGPSLALSLALAAGRVSATDYWDANPTNNDNGMATPNELYHGTSQQHDLQANAGPIADEDWYLVISQPHHSYEAVIDSTAGPLHMTVPPHFQRLNGSGAVVQTSEELTPGFSPGFGAALRWEDTSGAFQPAFLRAQVPDCLTCGPHDQYHIRFYETTVSLPRFNNAKGRVTILMIQNNTGWNRPIAGTIYFHHKDGFVMASSPFILGATQALVLNTDTVGGVQDANGSITVAHDGGYGNLAVKSVELEPASGFTFDTAGMYKPR